MESVCSNHAGSNIFSGISDPWHAVNKTLRQMDCVPSTSDTILINSESSKDDSVSSYDDPPSLRIEENGVINIDSPKKPTITLAKTVTLRNFESMSSSIIMNSSDIGNNKDNTSKESILGDGIGSGDISERDPLANSIVLSESDGETTNDDNSNVAQPSNEVVSCDPNIPVPARILVRIPSADEKAASAAGKESHSSTTEASDIEILSVDSTSQKKQLKVVVPSSGSKKIGDGTIQPVRISTELKECLQCNKTLNCNMKLDLYGTVTYLCSDKCLVENRFAQKASLQRAFSKPDAHRPVVVRKCGQCKEVITPSDSTLSWETMDFCNEDCLKLYQNKLGLQCSYCHQQCQEQSLGKYCVRFGFDIRQFCHSSCLEEYKKGIKVCSFCQEDIPNHQGIVTAMNERQQFKEFCSQNCMTCYDKMSCNMPVRLAASKCDVCNKLKLVTVEVLKAGKCFTLCSDVCFNAFKFVHPNPMGFCDMCKKHYDTENVEELYYTFADETAITFCSKTCMNAYVIFKRKIVQCNWCKVKKYNFDMIKKIFSNRQVMMLCSFHCFSMWKQSPKRNTCDHCKTFGQIQYHLGMSDGTLRSFCGHECLMKFQLQFKKVPVTPSSARPLDSTATLAFPVVTPNAKLPQVSVKAPPTKKPENAGVAIAGSDRTGPSYVVMAAPGTSSSIATICAPPSKINDNAATIPVISSVTSLEPVETPPVPDVPLPVTVNTPKTPAPRKSVGVLINKGSNVHTSNQVLVKQQLLLVPPPPPIMCNKSTFFCSQPATKSKGVYCKPNSLPQSTQTEFDSISDNDKELDDDNDDEEAEDKGRGKRKKNTVVEVKVKEVPVIIPIPLPIYIPVPIPMYNIPVPCPLPIPIPVTVPLCIPTHRESLQDALKEIQELCEKIPFVPTVNWIHHEKNGPSNSDLGSKKRGHSLLDELSDASGSGDSSNKRRRMDDSGSGGENSSRRLSIDGDESSHQGSSGNSGGGSGDGHQPPGDSHLSTSPSTSSPKKYIQSAFGVNAWKKWVSAKNLELIAAGEKPFGTELLWLSGEELCQSLSLFVTEFRKPSGQTFPADILFYLVLGIQAYMYDNERDVNIFSDPVYDKFTETFDQIIIKETLVDNSEFLVPRIEEEHLWESCLLGAKSPFTLLLTMLYFTTKELNITDVDSHMRLAFSQLMRQWPRGQSSSEKQMSGHLSVRYFPPNQPRGECSKDSSGQESKKKYEILKNYDNACRCPVGLYSYYVSKCPESMRNRSDVFYLQPEKSYLAGSPCWYTSEPLDKGVLSKMFNRLRLVKETSLVIHSELSSD